MSCKIFLYSRKEEEGGIGFAVNLVDKLGLFTSRQMNISCDKTRGQQREKAIPGHQLSSNLVCTSDWNCTYV